MDQHGRCVVWTMVLMFMTTWPMETVAMSCYGLDKCNNGVHCTQCHCQNQANMGSGKSLHGDYAWMSIVEFTDNFPVEFWWNYHSATPKQAVCIKREPILPDEVQFRPLR